MRVSGIVCAGLVVLGALAASDAWAVTTINATKSNTLKIAAGDTARLVEGLI